ncbi:MAG TPA: roadblock/LC7 domain-containing protein [Mycobacteriales bacterium]|nr:roadblock/LC7 domain-containing protein [Mycobacteriales bacterium]HWA68171.1 roadblock/LC7 domain-containing protein [Mycobacteriales bacterium]
MSDLSSRSQQLDRVIADLLAQAPEVEAAAVVSFDGLPMASALPAAMDEDRVAAMSASLLSLGERAAEGLGRGGLNQVYIEGDHGTVFLCGAEDEAVLVAVAAREAKVGMMLYEVRRAAERVAEVLRNSHEAAAAPAAAPAAGYAPAPAAPPAYQPQPAAYEPPAYEPPSYAPAPVDYPPAPPVQAEVPAYVPAPMAPEAVPYAAGADTYVKPVGEPNADTQPLPAYAPITSDPAWATHLPNGSNGAGAPVGEQQSWS